MLRVVQFPQQICGVRARFSEAFIERAESDARHFHDATNRPGASATADRLKSHRFSRAAVSFLSRSLGLSGTLRADPQWGFLTWENRDGQIFSVSLAHTEDAACVVIAKFAVGIDIESESRSVDKLASRLYTDFENTWSSENNIPRIHVWCAKESVLKALGTGIQGGLKKIELHPRDRDRSFYDVQSVVQSVIAPSACSAADLCVQVETWDKFVIAVSSHRRALEMGVHWVGD